MADGDTTLRRVRAEYLEMPGLRLTRQQAQRLWSMDRALCEHVLDALVAMKFLSIKGDGTYARATDGADHPAPAKARLRPGRRIDKAS